MQKKPITGSALLSELMDKSNFCLCPQMKTQDHLEGSTFFTDSLKTPKTNMGNNNKNETKDEVLVMSLSLFSSEAEIREEVMKLTSAATVTG